MNCQVTPFRDKSAISAAIEASIFFLIRSSVKAEKSIVIIEEHGFFV